MTGTRSSFVLLVILLSHAVSLTPAQAQETSGGDATTQRQRAEDLAREASERFTEILSGETGSKVAEGAGHQGAGPEGGPLNPIWDWLGQASRAYRGVIITKLKTPSGKVAILVPPGGAAPKLPTTSATSEVVHEPEPRLGWTYLVESVRDWLARANRSYRTEVVKKLVKPQPGARTAGAAPELEEAAPPQMAATPQADAAGEVAAPSPEPTSDEKRKAEAEAEAKRKAEAEAVAKREAEAEAKRKAEAEAVAKRKAEAEAKRKAEAEAVAKRKAEAEAKRKAEAEAVAKRKAEAEAKRKAEAEAAAKRKAAADAKRLAEEEAAEKKAVAAAKRMAAAMPKEPPMTVDRKVLPAPPERKAPPPADRGVPKARGEPVVSEPPPPPEAKSAKKSASKRHYRKRHYRKRRLRRHARAHHGHRVHRARRAHRAHRWHRRAHERRLRRCPSRRHHRRRAVRGWSGRVHVVRRGDTLTKISRRYYGTASGYRRIYRANRRKVRNPNLIYPRQRLYIPYRRR